MYCITTRRSGNFQLVQLVWFVTHTKKLEEVDFVDKEFLHKKVNKNGVYLKNHGVLQKIFQEIHVVKGSLESIMEI